MHMHTFNIDKKQSTNKTHNDKEHAANQTHTNNESHMTAQACKQDTLCDVENTEMHMHTFNIDKQQSTNKTHNDKEHTANQTHTNNESHMTAQACKQDTQ